MGCSACAGLAILAQILVSAAVHACSCCFAADQNRCGCDIGTRATLWRHALHAPRWLLLVSSSRPLQQHANPEVGASLLLKPGLHPRCCPKRCRQPAATSVLLFFRPRLASMVMVEVDQRLPSIVSNRRGCCWEFHSQKAWPSEFGTVCPDRIRAPA